MEEEQKMPLPNFLVIGAAKSGTTALYHALKQHPEIAMSPVKEPRFFTFENQPLDFLNWDGKKETAWSRCVVTREAEYRKLFQSSPDKIARGEVSPVYLSCFRTEETAHNIRRHLPEAALVAILRQPAERAYSAFCFMRQTGAEPLADFKQALAAAASPARVRWIPPYQYLRNGNYCALLKPYFERFPRGQFRIYLYEEWNEKPLLVLQDIFRFLHINGDFQPDITGRYNVTSLPRSRALQSAYTGSSIFKAIVRGVIPKSARRKIFSVLQGYNRIRPAPLDPHTHRELTAWYREDILNLQELIGRDLSHWLAAL